MLKKIFILIFLLVQGILLYATIQRPDIFIYNGKEYRLTAIEYPKKYLNIYSLGIKPIMLTTACWRGYIATYSISQNNKLILSQLYTNNGNNINNEIPIINGVLPNISTPDRLVNEYKDYRILDYNNIDLFIEYTGYIIISLYGNIENIKLNFINGELINTQEISSQDLQKNYKIINW